MPRVTCPNGHRIRVSDRHIGRSIKCPNCQSSFVAAADDQVLESDEHDKAEITTDSHSRLDLKGLIERFPILALANNFVGKPLLLFGLLFAILGRGCDATSMRSVARADAHYYEPRVAFDLEWYSKISAVQQKLDKKNAQIAESRDSVGIGMPRAQGGPGMAEDEESRKRMTEMQKEKFGLEQELRKVRADHTAALAENENGPWKPLRESAMKASNEHRMSIYWHEWLFIFGTVVLVLGVLTLAFTGHGAERWIAYIMIAIITFSIYVGGVAWIGSIVSSTGSTGGSGTLSPIERSERAPVPFPR